MEHSTPTAQDTKTTFTATMIGLVATSGQLTTIKLLMLALWPATTTLAVVLSHTVAQLVI